MKFGKLEAVLALTKNNKQKKKVSLYLITMGSVLIIMSIFAVVVQLIGYYAFTKTFENEYNETVYRIAELASGNVRYMDLAEYLECDYDEIQELVALEYDEYEKECESKGEKPDFDKYYKAVSYQVQEEDIQDICNTMNMSVIYIIIPDEDYEHYTVVFDCLNENNKLDKWRLGDVKETTNDDYKEAYKNIYENGSKKEIIERYDNLGQGRPHITALVPLYNKNNELMGILSVQRYADKLTSARKNFAQGVGAIAVILIIIIFIIEAKLLRNAVLKPIKVVSEEAGRFAKENTKGSSDLRDNNYSVKEIYDLASAIEKMEEDTIENIEKTKKIVGEQERIGADLALASRIQFSMLPMDDVFIEDKEEFDIQAVMKPAREVGGDFYDFYMISDHELVIEIADVSDKGLGAAFFMAITKTLIKSRAGMGGDASDIIAYVDKLVSEENEAGMFVTVWFAIINLQTGYVRVCNAGHDYPAIMKDGKDFVIEKTPHGPPIGFLPGAEFIDYDFYISPGDRIFLYTDGLNEAKRSDGERFGLDRVLSVLNSEKNASNKELIAAMKDSLAMFVGNEPQFDDMTVLSFSFIKYYEPKLRIKNKR